MHKPRLMFLLSSLSVGGSELKTIRLANALGNRVDDLLLAYLNPPDTLLKQVAPGITTIHLGRRGKFSMLALRALRRSIQARRIDVVIAVNLYPVLYAMLAKVGHTGCPFRVVASVNTTDFAGSWEHMQMLLYRHVLRRVDAVMFGANQQRQLWCSRYRLGIRRNSAVVLYNGVDTEHFSAARVDVATIGDWPASRRVLGTVGQLRVEKAHVHIVRVVRELVDHGYDVGAVIVGDGPERSRIEREIRLLGVDNRVQLVGEVTDVRPYLAAMDVFILPSIAVETFSNAALEAMAMARPIVASRLGGMEEMLQFGGGLTYPAGDVRALREHLIRLFSDPAQLTRLGNEARSVAKERFSWNHMLNAFTSFVLEADTATH